MRAWVTIALENDQISVTSNVDNTTRIALLEAAKFTVLTDATKPRVQAQGGSEPKLVPGANQRQAPGLQVRTVA